MPRVAVSCLEVASQIGVGQRHSREDASLPLLRLHPRIRLTPDQTIAIVAATQALAGKDALVLVLAGVHEVGRHP